MHLENVKWRNNIAQACKGATTLLYVHSYAFFWQKHHFGNKIYRNDTLLTKASFRIQYIPKWHSTVRAQLRCFINKSIIADTIYTGMIHWWQNHLSISNNTEMTHYWCQNHTWKRKVLDLHIMLKSCLKTKITDLPTFEKSHCRNDQNAGFTHFFLCI